VGVYGGPDVSESGLVLALDGANSKSFKGSAATNLLYSITNAYGTQNGTYFKTSYGDVVEYIPELGYKTVRYCDIFNDYPNSGDCCPSPLRYGGSVIGQTIAVSSSTAYTYQIIYKTKSGYTHPNFMYRYEYGRSGYVTEAGVHSDSNRTSLGNDWWFAWGQFTTQSTTTYLWLTGMWYYQYNVYDTIYIAGVSLHQGTNIIPAKFMLTPQENRGSTVATGGGWADLSGRGNNGELVNGVIESADNLGALVFDGTNDYISVSSLSNYNFGNSMSVFIFHRNVGGDYRGLINNGYFNGCGFELRYGRENYFGGSDNGTSLYVKLNTGSGTALLTINAELNVWGYYGFTYNGSQLISYKNGTQFSSTSLSGNINVVQNPVIIGWDSFYSQYLSGLVSQATIYNRALTATEVQQNFNANRSRFGI
jgi:hypothetical protein